MSTQTFSSGLPDTSDDIRTLAAKSAQSAANAAVDLANSFRGFLADDPVVTGPLVPIAFRFGDSITSDKWFSFENSGATISHTARVNTLAGNLGSVCSVSVPVGPHKYCSVFLRRYSGRRIGLRWYSTSGQPTEPLTMVVNGHPYEVKFSVVDDKTQDVLASGKPCPYAQWVCPDILEPGEKEVELIFLGAPATGATRAWIVQSWLLDSAYGYTQEPPIYNLYGPATGTGSYASFSASAPYDTNDKRVNRIIVVNPTAGAIQADVSFDAGSNSFFQRSVAANATEILDLTPGVHGIPYVKGNGLKFFVQAGSI